jgi:alginate O-acetyltransferase complex protein AlgI
MLVKGLDRLILGLVQKNLIANSLGAWVDEGFLPRVAAGNSTIDNWFLAIAFGLQIYYDFASYSNMAIGAAQLIGVTLPENFRFPYHARNPADFWSRWHMTLSRWIRDYLFFPVNARFKGAPGPLYVSLLGIMALVGLWLGAGWNFVLWGVLHGIYLALYRIWEAVQEGRFKGLGQSPVVLSAWRVFTLVAVMAAWVPFRAASGGQAATMLRSMFFDFRFATSFSANFYLVTLLIAAYSVIEPFLASAIERGEKWLLERHALWIAHLYILRPAIYAVGILMFMIFDDRDTQFIYFQF